MRDFVATFNKITSRFPTTSNLKTFFISAMPLDINYDLRWAHPTNLEDAQKKAVEFEDNLIFIGKWKWELQTKGSSSNTTSSNEMIQKISNELVVVKRQLPGFNNSYQWNYQNVPRRNIDGKFP